jgi:hypothetical protein
MEKRAAPRIKAFLKARAICQPNDSPVECLIVDVSKTGAKLQFVDGGVSDLPDRFELLIVKTGERPVVQVVWRGSHEIGVKFEAEDEKKPRVDHSKRG